ncbi:fimbrial protein [Pseudomonas chlororaphis]|uniref:fimbrial protein n=2 Tax=Pseudomonas chlororaphis TaxID=587753 RepID=UPI0006A5A469|nr:fimbrial protein [Pseudomonas chlororaphis]MBM0284160.1 fimbrial protein [Pseudomonas chlororaphis]MDO1505387.1 fimbrial protein [Pseudomonas chlororaphis]ORM50139.1 fimbrial protein [Pseudomonas chlororaphis subsp. chlororaphis]TWR99415.1 fimbrial protein [Pseudomonas chlororaphis subsp. chlororaphis]WDG99417.1 fimbrial protein [Pseudomonas chlororaphis]
MRKLIFILMFLSSLFARNALAAYCSLPNGTPLIKDIILPAQTLIKAASIGQEIARHRVTNLWSGEVRCIGLQTVSITADTALTPSALPAVYETGIKGVGVKFCLALDLSNGSWCTPYSWTPPSGNPVLPRFMDVVFVRTGRGVASGNAPMKFSVTWARGDVSVQVRSQGTTELVNDIFFAGCESVGAAVNVQMGKQTIENITKGSVREVPFNFDVRCEGLKPDTKVPVKAYFEGNSQADGLLKLVNLGQPGVASGVGISLVNNKGVKLPFDISRSVALDWNREIAEGSIYRFSGSAKYVPTGGEIKPGKGDATMSFVLNYN